MARKRSAGSVILRLAFCAYLLLMAWLLFGQRMDGSMTAEKNWNLIPFKTLKMYLQIIAETDNAALLRHSFINLAGNVIMFMPLGFFLPAIWRKQRNFFLCLLTAVLVVALIEAAQYFAMLGSCDVDDAILNIPGVMLGYGLQRLLCRNRR